MRFTHKAGEKMFIDFSGDKAHYQDPVTGKIDRGGALRRRARGKLVPLCPGGPRPDRRELHRLH